MSQTEERFYFKVPFDDKDDAKALGARFDGTKRQWFAPDAAVKEALAFRWAPAESAGGGGGGGGYGGGAGYGGGGGGGGGGYNSQRSQSPGRDRFAGGGGASEGDKILYDIPFDDNQEVKAMGARFDAAARKWFAPDSSVAQAMDQRWQRVGGGGGAAAGGATSYGATGQGAFARDRDMGQPGGYGGGGGYASGGYRNDRDRGYEQPPARNDPYDRSRYHRAPGVENQPVQGQYGGGAPAAGGGRVFFKVTFDEKDEAKGLGARWDKDARSWFSEEPAAISALEQRFGRK